MKESITAKGRVSLRIYDANDNLLESIEQENMVVNVGKQSLASLLGAATTDKRVSQIGFGTAATPTSSAQTSIENPFVKALDAVNYSGSTVAFDYSLALGENNGVTIREFALFSDDDTMFSRIVRNPIVKTSDIRLEGTWSITF